MPVIKIDLLEGQTVNGQRCELAEKITQSVCNIVKCVREVVTIIFNEIRENKWSSAGMLTDKPLYHPIVTIDMLDGKTNEQKHAMIEAITNWICEITQCTRERVVIIFHDISKDDWGSGGLPKSAVVTK